MEIEAHNNVINVTLNEEMQVKIELISTYTNDLYVELSIQNDTIIAEGVLTKNKQVLLEDVSSYFKSHSRKLSTVKVWIRIVNSYGAVLALKNITEIFENKYVKKSE